MLLINLHCLDFMDYQKVLSATDTASNLFALSSSEGLPGGVLAIVSVSEMSLAGSEIKCTSFFRFSN